MRLLVYDITGNNAMTREAGEAVYDIIHPLLLEKQPVELDFTGVHRYLTVFFNFSVGQLYGDVDADILSSLLKVAGLNSVG
ncbi:MAG: STAS-like domain-containing protein, partial [Cyanobacteria bacterium J06626_18]